MIKKLTIDNLKSIDRLEIECRNVNLFIGTNSSGKSTIVQSLLLLAQNLEMECGLNGRLLSIGEFSESKCRLINREEIKVTVENEDGISVALVIGTQGDKKEQTVHVLQKSDNIARSFSIKKRMVQYLSCTRTGPQGFYEKNTQLNEEIGKNGEYAFSYLAGHGNDVLEPGMCKFSDNFTFGNQVNYWLQYITGVTVDYEEIPSTDIIKVSYNEGKLRSLRPLNVGAGISYVISIIITCLAAPKNSKVIIENPEIHLHPLAQSKLCEFFYFIAINGRQVFLESHSDHIFNGFRAGITTSTMDSAVVNVNFVSQSDDGLTHMEKVLFGKRGRILNQRDNLFDQFDKDMIRMIGIG